MQKLDTYSQRLRYILDKRNITPAELSRSINESAQAIQYLLKPTTRRSSMTPAICKALKINEPWLKNGEGAIANTTKSSNSDNIDSDTLVFIFEVIDEVNKEFIEDKAFKKGLSSSEKIELAARMYNTIKDQVFTRESLIDQLKMTFSLWPEPK